MISDFVMEMDGVVERCDVAIFYGICSKDSIFYCCYISKDVNF